MKKFLLLITMLGLPILVTPVPAGAVDVLGPDVCNRAEAKDATVCKDKNLKGKDGKEQDPIIGSNGILTTVINLLTVVVAIISVIIIILAGLKMVTSSTNPQDVTNARERIIYALVAIAVAALAQALVRFIIAQLNE